MPSMRFVVQLPTGPDGFGVRVRTCRLLAGLLSQTALAKRAQVSKELVSYIELGHSRAPAYESVRKLASAIGVDPDWLATGAGDTPALLLQEENFAAYQAGVAAAHAGLRADAPKELGDVVAGWWLVGHGHELERQGTEARAS